MFEFFLLFCYFVNAAGSLNKVYSCFPGLWNVEQILACFVPWPFPLHYGTPASRFRLQRPPLLLLLSSRVVREEGQIYFYFFGTRGRVGRCEVGIHSHIVYCGIQASTFGHFCTHFHFLLFIWRTKKTWRGIAIYSRAKSLCL